MSTPDFDTDWEDACKAARTTPIGQQMFAAGYTIARTGGSGLAWSKTVQGGRYVWIEDEHNTLGTHGAALLWYGQLYNGLGDELATTRGNLESVLAWADERAIDPTRIVEFELALDALLKEFEDDEIPF